MTRKDYQLIAGAVIKMKSLGSDTQMYVADMLATELERENQRFNKQKFMEACGFVKLA